MGTRRPVAVAEEERSVGLDRVVFPVGFEVRTGGLERVVGEGGGEEAVDVREDEGLSTGSGVGPVGVVAGVHGRDWGVCTVYLYCCC